MTDAHAAELPEPTPHAGPGWGWIIAYGVLSVLLGIAAFVWPFSATFAATFVIACFFLASGIVAIGAGLFGRGHEGRGYLVAFGLLSTVIGATMAVEPWIGALSLTVMVAVWLGSRGVIELVLGLRYRRRRGWMIAMGAINLLLAALIVATVPLSALTLPGYILGLSFLFGGVASVAAGIDHRQGAAAFAVPR